MASAAAWHVEHPETASEYADERCRDRGERERKHR
jgi:hypothetical protein